MADAVNASKSGCRSCEIAQFTDEFKDVCVITCFIIQQYVLILHIIGMNLK